MNTRSVRFEYSINMSNINVDCSIILKVTNPHHFPYWRVHTLPAGSREKVFSVPCWLCFLALNTCSGLGCKYSSLVHIIWTGSLSCLSHCWGAFQCAWQSGTIPCGKVTSSYSLSDAVSLEDKQKVQLFTQPYSLVSPACRKGQGYWEISTNILACRSMPAITSSAE